tara:strand:- start:962 stop:1195 length:234 start_codon:yes stop_codon:yes gene_type:complete
MAKQINKIRIYMVETGTMNKWFGDRDTAIFFAQCLYDDAPIIINRPPIFEHIVSTSSDGLCKFLNKQLREKYETRSS